MTGLRNCILAALALPLLACSPQASEQVPEAGASAVAAANTHPVSGLEVIPVTVTRASGAHVIQAELAASRDAQRQGLMFRTEMGPDEGMLFPYDEPDMMGFWMRNTVIPLDLIFIDEDGLIINIEAGIPYNEESVESERPGIAVLELNGGRSEELGIAPGDRVEW